MRFQSRHPGLGVLVAHPETTFVLPAVTVPVLSRIITPGRASRSRTSPPLIRIPRRAARPSATVRASGVASPSAAGTSDDQQGYRVADGPLRRDPQPDRERDCRECQQRHDEPAGHPVGELDDGARRRLHSSTRLINLPTRVRLPTASTRITKRDATFTVPAWTPWPGSTGTKCDSPLSSDWSSVDCPSSTVPSTGTESPARTSTRSPGVDRLDRHFLDPFVLQAAGRRRGQREQQLDRIAGPPLLTPLNPAAHQQQKHQHRQRIEIDLASVPNHIHRARQPAGQQAQRDRQVEVGRARPQRRPRAAKEQAARPQQGDGAEQHAGPAEEPRVLVLDPRKHPAVQRERQRHHVARAGRRHADADQEAMVFAPPQLAGPHVASRMRRIAQRVQHPRDARQRDPLVPPADADQRSGACPAAIRSRPAALAAASPPARRKPHNGRLPSTIPSPASRRPAFGSTDRGTPRHRTRHTAAGSCAPASPPRPPPRGAGRSGPARSRGSLDTPSGNPGSRTARRRPGRPAPPAQASRSECNGRRPAGWAYFQRDNTVRRTDPSASSSSPGKRLRELRHGHQLFYGSPFGRAVKLIEGALRWRPTNGIRCHCGGHLGRQRKAGNPSTTCKRVSPRRPGKPKSDPLAARCACIIPASGLHDDVQSRPCHLTRKQRRSDRVFEQLSVRAGGPTELGRNPSGPAAKSPFGSAATRGRRGGRNATQPKAAGTTTTTSAARWPPTPTFPRFGPMATRTNSRRPTCTLPAKRATGSGGCPTTWPTSLRRRML